MARIVKLIYGFLPLGIFTEWSILDVWQGYEYSSAVVNLEIFQIYFRVFYLKHTPMVIGF